MSVVLRTDLSAKLVLRAIDQKAKYIRENTRADAKRAANRSGESWGEYSGKQGRALEILARAEAAEASADLDRETARVAIETAQEITDPIERGTAVAAARAEQTDARRRSAKAADVAATLRDKLGTDVVTTFDEWESKLWADVEAADARLVTLKDIERKALIMGDKITKDDAERWYALEPLPILLESTRVREASKASGGKAPKITDALLDDLDCFDSE